MMSFISFVSIYHHFVIFYFIFLFFLFNFRVLLNTLVEIYFLNFYPKFFTAKKTKQNNEKYMEIDADEK